MVTIPKSFTGGFGSLSGLLRNVTAAPAPAKATATTPAPTPAPVAAPTPAAPAKQTKLEKVSSYSAPAGTVLSASTVDALLKQNIDKGDPNLVTGEALKSLEQKGKIDPSLGNLLSSNAAVAKGAAALGVQRNERINQLGGAKEVSYSGDLVGAAKSLGIDTTGFTKTVSGAMGSKQTVIDKEKLYNAVNDKANQIGLYAITERDPGKTGSSDNATHVTTYYQNANGVLQPLKDANGKTATTTFKADTYTKDEGFLEGLVSGVRGIATELSPIISMALPNLGLTGLQLLAAQSAQAIATGASPTDVLKGAIGSLAAAQVPQFLDELKIVSAASPALKSAINNAAVQATFAAFTDQNIALNAIAGAIGGAAAELSKDLGDPALQKAIGEFTKNKALGMSDMQAGMAAAQDYLQAKSQQKTAGQQQILDEFGKPRQPSQQIGSEIAGTIAPDLSGDIPVGKRYVGPLEGVGVMAPSNDANNRVEAQMYERKFDDGRSIYYYEIYDQTKGTTNLYISNSFDVPGATGTFFSKTNQIPETLPPKENLPTTTSSTETQTLTPKLPSISSGGRLTSTKPAGINISEISFPSSGASAGDTLGGATEDTAGITSGGTTGANAGEITGRDRDIINLSGIGTSGTSTGTSSFGGVDIGTKGTGTSVVDADGTGAGGTGDSGTGTGGDGEGGDGGGDGTTETASQTFPLTPQQPDTVILDLISGGGTRRGQRVPTVSESESMAALTQALRIGDPGDALFGGKLGRRRNVWNVESLRLKDELGG